MKNENKLTVEHGPAKWNWVHGHGMVLTEDPVKPIIISQERLAEITSTGSHRPAASNSSAVPVRWNS
jgi:hypothetical protein